MAAPADLIDRHGRAAASTEDLRQAVLHYRALFEELVGDTDLADVMERRGALDDKTLDGAAHDRDGGHVLPALQAARPATVGSRQAAKVSPDYHPL